MADPQKTHKPTPKRIKESRKKGEVALSRDLVSAAAFAGGAIALIATGSSGFAALRSLTRDAAMAADGVERTDLVANATHAFGAAAFPVVIGAALGALVAVAPQLGWPPAFRGIKFDVTRMSPLGNLARTFAPGEAIKRTGTAIAKLVVIAAIVVVAARSVATARPDSALALVDHAATLLTRVIELVIGTLLAVAAVDYFLSRRKHMQGLMMSTEEIKREHKESDGDPHVKGKRRARAKEMAKRRIAAAVAKADVVIVNPTHYAVALRYDDAKDSAPIVVAKGIDEAAEKIREIARKHGVPILARPPLARALHKLVKEGRPVPAKLFRAVAEVLAYVYRIKHRGAA